MDDAMERELDKELRFHLESAIDDLVKGGMPRPEAERIARIQLGGLEQVSEEARDARFATIAPALKATRVSPIIAMRAD